MKKNSQAFINQLLVCLLVTFCFSGSIGLGTVWMRHQISLIANANKSLEASIAKVERRLDEIALDIETEQSPDVLRRRNVEFGLGMVQPEEANIVRITDDPERRLAAKASPLLEDRDLALPKLKLTLSSSR
jgi:hypothetical protein